MKIHYYPIWKEPFDQLAGKAHPTMWRKVDMVNDMEVAEGDLAVYISFGFDSNINRGRARFEYKGDYLVRVVEQTLVRYAGIHDGYTAIVLQDMDGNIEVTDKVLEDIKIEVTKVIRDIEDNQRVVRPPIPL